MFLHYLAISVKSYLSFSVKSILSSTQAHYVAEFVNKSISYKSNITIVFNKKEVSAKNIIEVMNLRLDIDNKIEINANGEDEKKAIIELKAFINDEIKTTNN